MVSPLSKEIGILAARCNSSLQILSEGDISPKLLSLPFFSTFTIMVWQEETEIYTGGLLSFGCPLEASKSVLKSNL